MNGFKRLERTCTGCGTEIWWNNDDITMKPTGSWYEGYPLGRIHDKEQCKKRKDALPYMEQAEIENANAQWAKKKGLDNFS